MRISKKLTAGLATGIAALSIATGAFAYFTADGKGAGSALVGSDKGLTITAAQDVQGLYPGRSVDVSYTVHNDSEDTAVYVGALYSTIEIDQAPEHAGCSADDFSFATAGVNAEIAATGNYSGSGELTMKETGLNQDACKGATVTVNLSTDAPAA